MQSKYEILVTFGKRLLDKENLDDGLAFISLNAKDILKAERCSIFMYDKKNNIVQTMLADNSEKISLPFDMGIVGKTISDKRAIMDNDPYDNLYFMPEIDMQTGYYTQNILTAPIFNSQNSVIGVLQLLNKKDGFYKRDREFIIFFSHYVSSYIEMMINK